MRIVIAVQGLAAGLAAAAADPIFTSCHARYYNGPLVSNPDTADAFRSYPPFQWTGTIRNASHTFDQEYAPVPGFINLNSAAQSPGYLFSVQPEAYDPSICASICETAKACEAFNICRPAFSPNLNCFPVTNPPPNSLRASSTHREFDNWTSGPGPMPWT